MGTLGQESRSYDVRSAYPVDTAIASGLYLIGWSSVAYLYIIGRYQPWLSSDALMVMFGVILVSIAVKPHGAWLVPNDYSIKFAEDREGERQRWELLLWAEEHDVPIVRGKAIRWL
ncbi:hypothetical protein [Saccharibacillus endophyticus]|uniref:Uncharacterized protein n=1 Tax=Saccharibacillus endophyticus TaxID=2060666 RepID=A0ABQ2A1T7_9BACL|nr:hypothetical protein [Saccharibacillus endophyticus]GGH84534.1 hypothetical protein GCM10007362_39820 [Saccharibacillus endophyticus]